MDLGLPSGVSKDSPVTRASVFKGILSPDRIQKRIQ